MLEKMKTGISLVLPVYNEEGNILPLFTEIQRVMSAMQRQYSCPWELIYVDDASKDSSVLCIQKIKETNPEVLLLEFEENCGQTTAFQAGFEKAQYSLIITMDADMQNDPADIPRMLEVIGYNNENEDLKYDILVGWRKNRKDTSSKRFASKIANAIRRSLTRDTIHDTGCSLKIMRSSMAKKLPLQYMGMHRFLVSLMQMQGARVSEIEVNHRERYTGNSKYSTWGRAIYALQDLLVVNWFFRRTRVYTLKK